MIVKIVMLILLVASIWSWSIIFEKIRKFYSLKKQAQIFESAFWSVESLEELYKEQENNPEHPYRKNDTLPLCINPHPRLMLIILSFFVLD